MSARSTHKHAPVPLLDSDQAKACLLLWRSAEFNTAEIAQLLNVSEPAVCRLIQAARDVARGLA